MKGGTTRTTANANTTNIENELINTMKTYHPPAFVFSISQEQRDAQEAYQLLHSSKKTLTSITNEIYNQIQELPVPIAKKKELCLKMTDYEFVDELNEIKIGRLVKWIKLPNPEKNEIYKGSITAGLVANIKICETGPVILCRCLGGGWGTNFPARFIQYRFNECLTFQRMTDEEQMFMMANELVHKEGQGGGGGGDGDGEEDNGWDGGDDDDSEEDDDEDDEDDDNGI